MNKIKKNYDKSSNFIDFKINGRLFPSWIASNFKKYQLDITFTDATAAMVEKEKVNTVDLKAKKIFEIADIDNLDKYKKQFDIVFCHNVLYHAGDKENSIKNLENCLNDKPSSFCSITTNSAKHMMNVYEIGKSFQG